eukprot:5882098-Prymnesium_polylepis.1
MATTRGRWPTERGTLPRAHGSSTWFRGGGDRGSLTVRPGCRVHGRVRPRVSRVPATPSDGGP